MKTALSGIPDDEKRAMSKKALADLKVYDDAYVQMESHHIPGKKTKLEFHLVDDMDVAEIFDHCILYGDSPTDLNIQSFFNFECQKFTKLKLITTMCDTLACFLGLNNENPLSKHSLVVGKVFLNMFYVFYFFFDEIGQVLLVLQFLLFYGQRQSD